VIDNSTAPSEAARPEAGPRTYVAIWAILVALTGVTVATAYVDLRAVAIIVCLAIATVKSTLVFLYFMHLRYEKQRLVLLVIPIAVVALAVFIGLTFSDVITR
jgi:cytochrome c oxidase subunit 4